MQQIDVDTVDYHTAGEPFRIVTSGVPALEGATILDKREFARGHLDHIRRLLVHEPRGHADMYGCFVTEPDDDGADLGAVFFQNEGYSSACGHGTIALVTWALDTGRVQPEGEEARVVVDVPSGRLETRAFLDGDRVRAVRFRNVAAYLQARGVEVATSSGEVSTDVAYGGAFYASVAASDVGLGVEPRSLNRFVALGREVKAALDRAEIGTHPDDDRLSGIYGVIFHEEVRPPQARVHQRNVTVFADGEVDRSPCGSGTSARLALLFEEDAIEQGEWMLHDSIVGTRFRARILEETRAHGRRAVITEIEGSAAPPESTGSCWIPGTSWGRGSCSADQPAVIRTMPTAAPPRPTSCSRCSRSASTTRARITVAAG